MKKFFGIVALAGIAAAATAQTGTYTWEVSSNNGSSWSSNANVAVGATVRVRLLASFAGVTGTDVGYAGGQFDATLTGATAASVVSNIVRPVPFAFAVQNLVATPTGATSQKIDTAADVAAPGAGTGWVGPGQSALAYSPGSYNSSNPAVVFTFDILAVDNISISAILNGTTGRSMAIYINAAGSQVRIDDSATTVNAATITVPSAGSLALLGLGGLAAARRRR